MKLTRAGFAANLATLKSCHSMKLCGERLHGREVILLTRSHPRLSTTPRKTWRWQRAAGEQARTPSPAARNNSQKETPGARSTRDRVIQLLTTDYCFLHRYRRAIKLRQTKSAEDFVVAALLIFQYPDCNLLAELQ